VSSSMVGAPANEEIRGPTGDRTRPKAFEKRLLLGASYFSAYGSFLAHSARTGSDSGTRALGRGRSVTERIAMVSRGGEQAFDVGAKDGGMLLSWSVLRLMAPTEHRPWRWLFAGGVSAS